MLNQAQPAAVNESPLIRLRRQIDIDNRMLAELNVIAAAVIGGTSLAGGQGAISGAILGAVVMQSLDNGMVLLGISSAMRQLVIGAVLILAVWFDVVYSKKRL